MDLVEVSKKKNYESISRHPWELARLNVITRLIRENLNHSSDVNIIDIGCGDTFVVEQLAKKYPQTSFYAVDIAFTDEMIDHYRKKINLKNVFLYSSTEDISSIPDMKASLIILADVIEHIENDIEFISQLLKKKFITSQTLFLITVPAFQFLFCSHDKFLGHFRRYTNKSLKNNMASAGLNTMANGYFFFFLIPFRMAQVIKEKLFNYDIDKTYTGLVTWNGSRSTSNFFKKILILDFTISFSLQKIGIKIPGLSNYAVCKKSV